MENSVARQRSVKPNGTDIAFTACLSSMHHVYETQPGDWELGAVLTTDGAAMLCQ